ncbi:AAA family ATPase [Holophaga foetida]|uniref:AAA family ATPase n=1 Tax=Holophaga foetida TaxID=35839 RepID=UPI0002473348|nr:DUF3696 domain-containing protein [Holophaga foetida]
MLSNLQLENFKAIAAAQGAPLKPLTLIFGKNSAGKSSLLQSLALMHEAVRTGTVDIDSPKIGNGWINLGGFRNFIHKHDQFRSFRFKVGFDQKDLPPFLRLHAPAGSHFALELEFGYPEADQDLDMVMGDVPELASLRLSRNGSEILGLQVSGATGLVGGEATPGDEDYTPEAEEKAHRTNLESLQQQFSVMAHTHLEMANGARRYWQSDRIDFADALFAHAIEEALETRGANAWARSDDAWLGAAATQVVRNQIFASNGLLPSRSRFLVARIEQVQVDRFIPEAPTFPPEAIAHLAAILGRVVASVVESVRLHLENELNKMLYIGPIRQFPERGATTPGMHTSDDPLLQAWTQIRENRDLRKEVNHWLGAEEKLGTGYRFVTRDYISAAYLERKMLDNIRCATENCEREETDPGYEAEISSHSTVLIRQFDPHRLEELLLVDARSGTQVSHRDVGFGISQVIPILAACLGSSQKLICVEQPEIHIHPGLQAELADLFIDSAMLRGNQLVVETHSEHLILRLLRRIREHAAAGPEAGGGITPDQVSVLYVDADEEGSFITEIPITREGEFGTKWPQGFFTERFKEVF